METFTASTLHRLSESDKLIVQAWVKRFVDLNECADFTIHEDGWTTFTLYRRNLNGERFWDYNANEPASMRFPKPTDVPPPFVLEVIERGLSNMRPIEG